MLRPRVIPALLIRGTGLVKTVKFADPKYLGDPRNTVRIFNEKEVDELVLLDILAPRDGKAPQYDLVREIVSEAFMPIGYGGGLRSLDDCLRMLALGVEKVIVNTAACETPQLVTEVAERLGSSTIVVSMDVRRSLFGKYEVCGRAGQLRTGKDPVMWAREMEERGAGELLLNAIDRDGMMQGYDLELLQAVTAAVSVPVVACGGAGSVDDLGRAVREGHASAAAAGSLFVFKGRHRAVLINFPGPDELRAVFDAQPR